MSEKILKYKITVKELTIELGREPTDEEVSDRTKLTQYDINNIKRIQDEPISLSSRIGEDEDSEIGDFIPAKDANVEGEAINTTLRKELIDVMNSALTEREQDILRMRTGFDSGEPMTLEEVGKKYGVTRERIRQVQAKGLRKLRSRDIRCKLGLRDYLDD